MSDNDAQRKIYLRKLKNRISARVSRKRREELIDRLERENEELKKQLIELRYELNKLNK
jgi:hypothetical protein